MNLLLFKAYNIENLTVIHQTDLFLLNRPFQLSPLLKLSEPEFCTRELPPVLSPPELRVPVTPLNITLKINTTGTETEY